MRASPWPRAESDKPAGGFGVGLADGSTVPLLWAQHPRDDKTAAVVDTTAVACSSSSGPSSFFSSRLSASSSSSSTTTASTATSSTLALPPPPRDPCHTRTRTTATTTTLTSGTTPYAALPRRLKIAYNLSRMVTTIPHGRGGEDLAVWVGVGYTVGATLWVINGFFAWLPLALPGSEFPGQVTYGTGVTSLLGVLCFETPAFIAYLIAVNDGPKVVDDGRGDAEEGVEGEEVAGRPREMAQKKSHDAGTDDLEDRWHEPDSDQHNHDLTSTTSTLTDPPPTKPFRYLPQRHHLTSINFWGSTIQLLGCTLFVVTGIVVQPGLYENLSVSQLMACLWVPLIVASAFFITASLLFILDRQDTWYRIAPQRLGWWIGVWSLIGSIGFETCGALAPFYWSDRALYHSSLASLWGSSAYLVSGALLWYQAVSRAAKARRKRLEAMEWETRLAFEEPEGSRRRGFLGRHRPRLGERAVLEDRVSMGVV